MGLLKPFWVIGLVVSGFGLVLVIQVLNLNKCINSTAGLEFCILCVIVSCLTFIWPFSKSIVLYTLSACKGNVFPYLCLVSYYSWCCFKVHVFSYVYLFVYDQQRKLLMERNWLANGILPQRVHLEGTTEFHPSPKGDDFLKLLHLYYQMMTTLLMPPLTRS